MAPTSCSHSPGAMGHSMPSSGPASRTRARNGTRSGPSHQCGWVGERGAEHHVSTGREELAHPLGGAVLERGGPGGREVETVVAGGRDAGGELGERGHPVVAGAVVQPERVEQEGSDPARHAPTRREWTLSTHRRRLGGALAFQPGARVATTEWASTSPPVSSRRFRHVDKRSARRALARAVDARYRAETAELEQPPRLHRDIAERQSSSSGRRQKIDRSVASNLAASPVISHVRTSFPEPSYVFS